MRSLWTPLFASISIAVVTGCAPPNYDSTARHDHGTATDSTEPAANAQGAGGDVGDDDGTALVAADDSKPSKPGAAGESFAGGATSAQATDNLNLRQGPSATTTILAIIPAKSTVDLISTTASNGFLNVTYNGVTGWAHSAYLVTLVDSTDTTDISGPPSVQNAIVRAQSAMGFSYNWGNGAWLDSGATSSTRGSCSGTCPSCSHHGQYGADCSGLVAKVWQFGPTDLSTNSHPYSTSDFVDDLSGHWATVSRDTLQGADALVYRSGSAGHIALYEKGDGWGTPTVYECRGCSYGCVHDSRSFSSVYHGIRRDGF